MRSVAAWYLGGNNLGLVWLPQPRFEKNGVNNELNLLVTESWYILPGGKKSKNQRNADVRGREEANELLTRTLAESVVETGHSFHMKNVFFAIYFGTRQITGIRS
jgi:hypothetical protein